VHGPPLQGDREGFLHRLLGQVEVTQDPDEGCDRPALLLPEQAVDDRPAFRRAIGATFGL